MWQSKYWLMFHWCMCLIVLKSEAQKLQRKNFVTLHKWTEMKLKFPTDELMRVARQKGYYEPTKLLPVDVDVEYGDDGYHRTFLTIPRLNVGVPYSLATIADSDNATLLNPDIIPYPSYDWHTSHGSNCTGITSAIRTFIDECWRLWVVDSGQINSLQYCAPQILAFDLVTDKLIHQYTFPKNVYIPGVSVFTALVVDVAEESAHETECKNTMIYIADPWAYGLIVYDTAQQNSWRIEHELMRPDKNLQKLNSASDGIFTVSLTPRESIQKVRKLYFHALNSYTEISIPLHIVNNVTLWTKEKRIASAEFRVLGSRGVQCESEIMDSAGNLYCSLISSTALISWREGSNYIADNLKVVAYNPAQLKFLTGLKVNKNSAGEDELWALSSDPTLFIGGKINTGAVKFQIIGCRTKNLITNKRCTVAAARVAKQKISNIHNHKSV